ncbi:phospholipid phosphatase 5-like [Spodoptera litura]|uniref:Phospholipid phosphatase 5-like n=1 Tax=Spodoptera litura TaxID=69820 RepID=A0A9J7IZQ7_SPOLT|nr:phospholipid phosphatase 5-like [Spodoptera litura]
MWQSTHYGTNNLLWEILLRVILLGLVCISQIKSRPYIRHISEAELLNEYRRPRLDSYVPAWATVLLIVFVPLVCICTRYMTTRDYVDTAQSLLAWTLALTINAVITESVKLIIGRPRPDFFWRCFPDGQVMPGLRCTGNPRDIIEGRKSFPSGHSSFSFCSLSFLSLWLCGKLGVLSRRRGRSCSLVICLVPLMIASVVALSRYCDNHHHWEDVFVGSLLGVACSYFCYQQYYHPLESEWSGEPYAMIDNELFMTSYDSNGSTHHVQCCTKDIDNVYLMLQLSNKKKMLDTNKTFS